MARTEGRAVIGTSGTLSGYRLTLALRVGAAAPWLAFAVAGTAIAVSGAYDGIVLGVIGLGIALALVQLGIAVIVVAILAFLLGLSLFLGIGISGDYYVNVGAPRVLVNMYTLAPLLGAIVSPPLAIIAVVIEWVTRRRRRANVQQR
jgi:hypothetical protein